MLKHTPRTTFEENTTSDFVKYAQNEISDVTHLDLVWGRYFDSCLKGHTQDKRVKDPRRLGSEKTLPIFSSKYNVCNQGQVNYLNTWSWIKI